MTSKAVSLAITMLAALSLGACAQGPHKPAMMGGRMSGNGMMGCPMMQKQTNAPGERANGSGMASGSGCPMMGNPAKGADTQATPKPDDTEDHSAHAPPA